MKNEAPPWTKEETRYCAARLGFELRPFSPTVVDTVQRVALGFNTGALLASAAGIERTTALGRLRRGTELGLLRVVQPTGRGENSYRLALPSIGAPWLDSDEIAEASE